MIPQVLLHPDHVMPLAQLIAATAEMGNGTITKTLMKGFAAWIGIGNAGIQILHTLLGQQFL